MYELHFSEEKPLNVLGRDGRRYPVKHFLRTPNLVDWCEYERALAVFYEETGSEVREVIDTLPACAALWDRICTRVEGYTVYEHPDGGGVGDMMSAHPKDWRDRVSLAHKVAAVQHLSKVFADFLDAVDEGAPGALVCGAGVEVKLVMIGYIPSPGGELTHIFAEPSPMQEVRASRLENTKCYQLATASQPARTVRVAALQEWVALYDELIRDVRGYAAGNAPVTGRERAVQHMDAWHKQAAVKGLFFPQERPVKKEEQPASEAGGTNE